jgi:hypothetical protein
MQDFLVGKVLDPAGMVDPELVGDVLGGLGADAVDVGERNDHALVGGDVDPGNTSHLNLHAPQGPAIRLGAAPISTRYHPVNGKKPDGAHGCNRLPGTG